MGLTRSIADGSSMLSHMTQAEVEAQRAILQPKSSMKAEAKAAISFKDGITQMRIRAVKASIETIEKKLSGDAPLGKDDDRESLGSGSPVISGQVTSGTRKP